VKTVGAGLLAVINAGGQIQLAELYTLTLQDASVYRWTNGDMDIVSGGNTFIASGPRFSRGKISESAKLEVATLDLTIQCAPGVTFLGLPMPLAAINGALDGATLRVERAYMTTYGDTSNGTILRFQGAVTSIAPSSTAVKLTVSSDLNRLNLAIPRVVFQPQCSHQVYDAGCALVRASFTVFSSVSAGSTLTSLPSPLTQADDYFRLGAITITSGPNAGVRRAVSSFLHTSGIVGLAIRLPALCNTGDTFTIWPGCDKKLATCTSKFANQARFRGFPFVPKPEAAQ